MSKTLAGAYQTHLDTGTTTLAYALRITRTDGEVFGFTSAGEDVTIGSVDYSAAQGLSISSIVTTAGLGVDSLELSTLDDGSLFTRADVLGGVWQNAAFLIFRYNWVTPGDGTEPLLAGTIGNVELQRGMVLCELRGLQQYLQQPVGNVTSKTCRARFADYPTANGSNLCRLTAATYLKTGTVTSVTDKANFAASAVFKANVVDWYGDGILTWTAGNNNGLAQKVRTHATGGVFTLMLPMPSTIQVGDTFKVIAGCRKRLSDDCNTKFSNVLNFQGEPHIPGLDALTATPDAEA